MALCGPKLSLCCLLLSVWGVIQLALMGIFFFNQNVALVEDLDLPEIDTKEISADPEAAVKAFHTAVSQSYNQNAYNCWIAAGLYVVTFLVSAHQFYLNNNKNSPSTAF